MYAIFDVLLDCDFPLPELLERSSIGGDIIQIRIGRASCSDNEKIQWFHDWKDSHGEICISGGKIDEDYLLRFPGLADMRVSNNAEFVEYFPQPGVPTETIRHLLLDQVVPRMLAHKGRLVLHASAIELPSGDGIAFLGNSGWGKSTIATSFHECGARLLTDDTLLLEVNDNNLTCIPNYYGARLFEDSAEAIFAIPQVFSDVAHYTDKKRLVLSRRAREDLPSRIPIKAIFILTDPNEGSTKNKVTIELIEGARELMVLIEQTFMLDISNKKTIMQQFKNTGCIANLSQTFYRLGYPHDYSLLPEVQLSINRTLG